MENIFTFIQYDTCDICPGLVFQWEFNGGVRFVIRLTIFGNFFVLYVCICIIYTFSEIQSWQWLCHPKTIFWKYIIWSSPDLIFQCEFSYDHDHIFWKLYFKNIWYGYHQISFFSMNSVITVIILSEDYILKYMICHHQASFFSVNSVVTVIMSSEDYILNIYDMIINKHHFHFIKFKTRRFFKLMLRLKSKTGKHIWDNVKAKI